MSALPVLVFLVFLVMKLAELGSVADWSWWWVTSPLWISAGLWLVFILPIQLLIARSARKVMRETRSIHRGYRF